ALSLKEFFTTTSPTQTPIKMANSAMLLPAELLTASFSTTEAISSPPNPFKTFGSKTSETTRFGSNGHGDLLAMPATALVVQPQTSACTKVPTATDLTTAQMSVIPSLTP